VRTDQFGTGTCIVDALVDGMEAVDQVVELAQTRKGIEVFRNAPDEIIQRIKGAERLPDEIYEIAHKKLYGEWPEYIRPDFDIPPSHCFTRKVLEEACA